MDRAQAPIPQAAARCVGDQGYAVRDRFGLADLSAGSTLDYLEVRFPELDWRAAHPNLGRYIVGLMRRPSFQDTVPYSQRIVGSVV